MKKILVVTTFNNHFNFFYRFSLALKQLNFDTHFLTNKYSILKDARSLNQSIFDLSQSNNRIDDVDIKESFEVAAEAISVETANKIVGSVWMKLEQLNKEHKYEYILLWGGVRLIELTAGKFAEKEGIKTIYFELGNFPEKIFVDPKGTNARSLLAQNSSLLKQFNSDLNRYKDWRDNYRVSSLKNHSVPQSSSASGIEYTKNLWDLLGFNFKKLIQNEPIITKEKIIGKYLRRFIKLDYDEIDITKTKYLFLPMQVNKDAQLILNSSVGNLDALNIASRLAKEGGLTLLVKPHPGEVEFGFINKVNKLKEELGFKFVNNNTIDLIINSAEVITINSTVGLQAKILGKKVTCLGKAFYSDIDEMLLAAYIQDYLIDSDFWGNKNITLDSAQKIINRADLK